MSRVKSLTAIPMPEELMNLLRGGGRSRKPEVKLTPVQELEKQRQRLQRLLERETRRFNMMEHLKKLCEHPVVAEFIALKEKVEDEHLLEPDIDHLESDCGDADCPEHGYLNRDANTGRNPEEPERDDISTLRKKH